METAIKDLYSFLTTTAKMDKRSDDVGGLSVGMINLIVVLVILGAGFMVSMGYGFARLFNKDGMAFEGPREPSQDQVSYMRQVRYRTRLGMFVGSQNALKGERDSRYTEEGPSSVV